ncbi:MAG: putative hydrolase of the HAD superfamily [Bradymonadia bacterium]
MPADLYFDLDHTLWDFETNSRAALRVGYDELDLATFGVPSEEVYIQAYEAANYACWAQYRAGTMDKATLRSRRFQLALKAIGLPQDDVLSKRLGDHYIATAPRMTAVFDGAVEVVSELCERGHRLTILSNGFEEAQHLKVECCGLKRYFDVVLTSDSMGHTKPDPRAFAAALDATGGHAERSIMIGDSWEADIKGAKLAGWRQVHFNPQGEEYNGEQAWRTVSHLRELLTLPLAAIPA